ncbi:MAG: CofH family radical SAM protein [Spirochaetes bacterium]|jgi:aminodeoxyfutalosine synthase|nr:CofH family radical SAM protein [Spirochaetota bacterium]
MIDRSLIADPALNFIADLVEAGEPVGRDSAGKLFSTMDIIGLGAIANHARESINGNRAFYGVNINLNYTNICTLRCPLCAFSRDACDSDAYTYTLDEIERRVREASGSGIDEVHIVGGLNPDLKLEYFEEMIGRIKGVDPDIFVVAFTAAEYDFFSKVNGIPIEEVFSRLIDAGVGALPGGGAEIFAPDKRRLIAPDKISGDRWLEVMRTAHSLGLKTNATLLYNHVEETEDIIDHIIRLRSLQDETGGFKSFVPLPFHEENTRVKPARGPRAGFDDIRLFASARILLNNIPHIKALWMYLGEKMAEVLLRFGVDDIGATYANEKVVHSAGASTPDYGTEEFLLRLIKNAGRDPVRTAADYGGKRG